jgi:hypothetical protein
VAPNHHGKNVVFQLQRYGSGSWKGLGTASFQLNKDSKVLVGVDHRSLDVGVPYRIRARFPNDADHLGDTAPWSYFRMT